MEIKALTGLSWQKNRKRKTGDKIQTSFSRSFAIKGGKWGLTDGKSEEREAFYKIGKFMAQKGKADATR